MAVALTRRAPGCGDFVVAPDPIELDRQNLVTSGSLEEHSSIFGRGPAASNRERGNYVRGTYQRSEGTLRIDDQHQSMALLLIHYAHHLPNPVKLEARKLVTRDFSDEWRAESPRAFRQPALHALIRNVAGLCL